MEIIIYFIGLISHVTQPAAAGQQPRQIAILVEANQHDAELIVASTAEIPTTAKKLKPLGSNPRPNGDNHYDIGGVTIEILGLPIGSRTTLMPNFVKYVPSLKAVTNGTTLHPNVVAENQGSSRMRTIIGLYGGDLDVAGYYEWEDKNRNFGPSCVASKVKYTVPIGGTAVEIVTSDGRHLRVKGGTEITIRNLPIMAGNPAHYEHKKDLLANATTIGTWLHPKTVKCAQTPIFTPVKFADTDCSNSQFP